MNDNFGACLTFTLGEEGGFVNNPKDPGGATNYGITLNTLAAWSAPDSTSLSDLLNLSDSEVQAIYSTLYWNAVRADALAAGLDLMVFDEAVNAGPARSAKLLQTALGFTGGDVDGCIGPQTLGAVAQADPAALISVLASTQGMYYQSLPGFATFGAGWTNRLNARETLAVSMIGTS